MGDPLPFYQCPQRANLNLFQILRQIPRSSQHTVNFHDLIFIVDYVMESARSS